VGDSSKLIPLGKLKRLLFIALLVVFASKSESMIIIQGEYY